jgi:uncharacterized phage-associated protein
MPTAIQVADWIVRFRHDDFAAPVDPMSLEKLIYYAQCFRLALVGERLFSDDIYARRHGPVIPAVYDAYETHGAQPIIPTPGDAPQLGTSIEQFLSEVVSFFGRYTGLQLSSATHAEDPWITARHGYSRRDNSDILMPAEQLRSYYCSLISEGEEALSRHELLDVISQPRWAALYVAGISFRRISWHPFYSPGLAKELSGLVSEGKQMPDDFYAPISDRELIEFGEKVDADEIIKRAIGAA